MTRAAAVARARDLEQHLERYEAIRAVSIELRTGRSGGWNNGRYIGTLGHHIVSKRSQGQTPFLSLVKNGRSDLPGPLANCYGGFDRVARIITMDWANHPGRGGPLTLPGGTIPRNNGRPYLAGWEFEGGLLWDDWPPEFRAFMSACLAGTLDWLGRDERSHAEHGTWAVGRKSDRLRYASDLPRARREIAAARRGVNDGSEDGVAVRMNQKNDGAALAVQVLANRAADAHNDLLVARGDTPKWLPLLDKDDHAGPKTHDRVNDLLDDWYDNRVSRRNEQTITEGGQALLAGIEASARRAIHELEHHGG